jgi:hypothetical protein
MGVLENVLGTDEAQSLLGRTLFVKLPTMMLGWVRARVIDSPAADLITIVYYDPTAYDDSYQPYRLSPRSGKDVTVTVALSDIQYKHPRSSATTTNPT